LLNQRQKIYYGMGRFGSSVMLNLVSLFTLYVYIKYFALSGLYTGLAAGMGKLSIAFASWLSGYFSDITPNNRFGRRRVWVIFFTPILAFFFIMQFSPQLFVPLGNEFVVFLYLAIFGSGFQASYALLTTPFQAWMPEVVPESERIEVSGYQNTANFIGNLVGTGLGFLLPSLIGDPETADILGSAGIILLVCVLIIAGIELLFYLPSIFLVPDPPRENIPPPNPLRELKIILSNRNYVSWILVNGIHTIGLTSLATIVLVYIDDVLQLNVAEYIIFGISLFGTIIVLFIFWGYFSNRYSKTKTYLVSQFYLALVLPTTLVVGQGIIPLPLLIQGIIFALLLAVGMSGYFILPYAIMADIVEKDERDTGEARAGHYTGFFGLPLNIFQAGAVVLTGILVDKEILPLVSGQEYTIGLILWGPICGIFIFIAAVLFYFFVNADPLRKGQGSLT
jgi:GPH family glycoside/pentoside/hexuronide:cation symporter